VVNARTSASSSSSLHAYLIDALQAHIRGHPVPLLA
jgi:hypothetical protein